MEEFGKFLVGLIPALFELFSRVVSGTPMTPEEEKEAAMKIVRAASDAQMRKDLNQ